MIDTKYQVGDIVTVRDDLVEGRVYYMDGGEGSPSDTYVDQMMEFLGKQCEITEITEYGKYRIEGSFLTYADCGIQLNERTIL